MNALTHAEPGLRAAPAPFKLNIAAMPLGLALYFDDDAFRRCTTIAEVMAKQTGIIPEHLIGKPAACMAVVTMSVTWNLAPQFVAASTYMTPGGKIGYEGKLIQAVLEASNRFVGAIKPEFIGDWDRIRGRWKMGKSDRGKDIPIRDWKDEDEIGLGVRIVGQVKGETEPREFTMWLRECFPRNSTLWPIRPSQQIIYTAMRAFANIAAPSILMGVPFAGDDDNDEAVFMRDITPKEPKREDFQDEAKPSGADSVVQPAAASTPEPGPAVPAHDETTGELKDDEPAEFSAADAYDRGREYKRAGRSMFAAVDPNWPEAFADAAKQGWRDEEEAMKAEAKSAAKAP